MSPKNQTRYSRVPVPLTILKVLAIFGLEYFSGTLMLLLYIFRYSEVKGLVLTKNKAYKSDHSVACASGQFDG